MDKRTLELAAKAAGYKFRVSGEWGCIKQEQIEITLPSGWKEYRKWSPLADWNDTAVLAKDIGAIIDFDIGLVNTPQKGVGFWEFSRNHNNSIQRALVALAVRIGESMQ